MGMGRADENGSVASSIRHADRFNNLQPVRFVVKDRGLV